MMAGWGRLIRNLWEMFRDMLRGLPHAWVFTKEGSDMRSRREAFEAVCRRAGIGDFTFHDLWHTAIHNRRLADPVHFRIMGHGPQDLDGLQKV